MTKKWQELLEKTVPLYRHICSPGLDECITILGDYFSEMEVHYYPTDSTCWTWDLPRKWNISDAWVKRADEKIIDFKVNELSVITGSKAIDEVMSFERLNQHIRSNQDIPEITSWEYSYFNEDVWGFSIPYDYHQELLNFNQKNSGKHDYHVYIESQFYDDNFSMASCLLEGESEDIIIISSDICHPKQANDSMSGVAVAYLLYEYLKSKKKRWFSYLFVFQPEYVGTVAFFSDHEYLIERIKYGIYTEIVGTPGPIVLQKSFTGNSAIDLIAIQVLMDHLPDDCIIKPFLTYAIGNDEVVLSMPGLRIPTIAINRGGYREYHSDADTLEIIDPKKLESAADIVIEIVKKLEKERPVRKEMERIDLSLISQPHRYAKKKHSDDYVPVPLFKGVIFLSKYGLYISYKENYKLAINLHKIMILINGFNSCSSIAYACGLTITDVLKFMDKLVAFELVKKK